MSIPPNSVLDYPADPSGFVRQCAWCRRIADADGRFRILADTLLRGASHGCCEACAIRFLGADQRAA